MNIHDKPAKAMFWVFANTQGAVICLPINQKQFDKMAGSPGLSFLHLEGATFDHDILYAKTLNSLEAYMAVDNYLLAQLKGDYDDSPKT